MNDLRKESVTWTNIDEGSCDQRIDNFLYKHLKGVPKSHIYRILRSGEVRVIRSVWIRLIACNWAIMCVFRRCV